MGGGVCEREMVGGRERGGGEGEASSVSMRPTYLSDAGVCVCVLGEDVSAGVWLGCACRVLRRRGRGVDWKRRVCINTVHNHCLVVNNWRWCLMRSSPSAATMQKRTTTGRVSFHDVAKGEAYNDISTRIASPRPVWRCPMQQWAMMKKI